MVKFSDVTDAQKEIRSYVHETPILTSRLVNVRSKNQVFFKAEHLQRTGSFKIRGAANAVRKAVRDGATFITAASSGNHGQAVAFIANELGVPAVIVVPEDASEAKISAIQAYNGEIVYCGTTSAHRIPKAKELAAGNGGVYIPPYDHPNTIAGQGTIGLELLEQVPHVDIIVVPIGGGGLISGILTAVKHLNQQVKVIGVEPATANDTKLSMENGTITAIENPKTIADGLRTSQPGDLTFPIMKEFLDDLLLVSEEEIKEAFQYTLERTKQLIEPSSAVAVAAVINGKLNVENKNIAIILSGGNVDLRNMESFLP
ncbi:MAG TPA: threonine/serine dehydratase [Planococcus sp. (in: firmicutes)]|nr:threonine/serine dehydratase [Planococcus sp. (in: firmicutes)]